MTQLRWRAFSSNRQQMPTICDDVAKMSGKKGIKKRITDDC